MLNLGLMKIRLVSASGLPSADTSFIPSLPTGRQAQDGFFRWDFNKNLCFAENLKILYDILLKGKGKGFQEELL